MQYFERNKVRYSFEIFPQVYPLSDDSFLMAENMKLKAGERVLDMGTGCGIQGIIAAKDGGVVTACDISKAAVDCAKYNAKMNSIKMEVVRSDLFSSIRGSYDLILFNPPYLISDPTEPDDELKKTWDGGYDGREVLDRFLSNVKDYLTKNGRILIIQSSANDPRKTLSCLEESGFSVNKLAEKSFFFEKLYVLEIFKVKK